MTDEIRISEGGHCTKELVQEWGHHGGYIIIRPVTSMCTYRHCQGVWHTKGLFIAWVHKYNLMECPCRTLEDCPTADTLAEDPAGLTGVFLMKHQKHALAWMGWRERQTPSAGILGMAHGLHAYWVLVTRPVPPCS